MHIGLSASSMSDISFLLEILVGLLFLVKAADTDNGRTLYLSVSLAAFVLSVMTRYEGWLFIPIYPLYYFFKTRRLFESLLILVILSLFPCIWMLGNYLNEGTILLGLSGAREYSEEVRTGPVKTIRNVARVTIAQFGWVVALLSAAGITQKLYDAIRLKVKLEMGLYVAVTMIIWGFTLCYGYVRGVTMLDRYFFIGFVFVLPYALVPIAKLWKEKKSLFTLAALVLVLLFGIAKFQNHPFEKLTHNRPQRMQQTVQWLKGSKYSAGPVLLTRLWWESTYFPVLFPEIGKHDQNYFIFARHIGMSNERYEQFLEHQQPVLLITCDDDRKLIAKTESIIGARIDTRSLVHEVGVIKMYDIQKQVASFTHSTEKQNVNGFKSKTE
jgi:hypothetical protein